MHSRGRLRFFRAGPARDKRKRYREQDIDAKNPERVRKAEHAPLQVHLCGQSRQGAMRRFSLACVHSYETARRALKLPLEERIGVLVCAISVLRCV